MRTLLGTVAFVAFVACAACGPARDCDLNRDCPSDELCIEGACVDVQPAARALASSSTAVGPALAPADHAVAVAPIANAPRVTSQRAWLGAVTSRNAHHRVASRFTVASSPPLVGGALRVVPLE